MNLLRLASRLRRKIYAQKNRKKHMRRRAIVSELREHPENPGLHLQLALEAEKLGNWTLALAEAKTSQQLGLSSLESEQLVRRALEHPVPIEDVTPPAFARFQWLSDCLKTLAGDRPSSILDVGGGQGMLAQVLPEFSYALVDPATNGVDAAMLPFGPESFDYVVACHVLEHIPPDQREEFLDELFARARRALVLLNPFHIAEAYPEERMRLVIELTGAAWAKEHLDCTFPPIEFISAWCGKRELEFTIAPKGSITTVTACVFLDHYLRRFRLEEERRAINKLFNTCLLQAFRSEDFPNNHLVVIRRGAA
jgi:SAM-dependent methyltransferase